ncbi:hypothetical protein [Roseovarius sp. M141]|uniref:hypothetical protein n=1 Tax=Roseovarius sp. M141 TaxID=2583806 RepID=UPI0020CDB973|nr:hypothetical protein [Roseovarius sp. M141]MCQ0092532.1 hypothetical protein [Roseovarius sp. M141]
MLQIDKVQTIEGITVYGDSKKIETHYPLPSRCSFRKTPEGKLDMGIYKYRMPIDREDGKVGGGFLIFSVAFVLPDDKVQPLKDALQAQVNAEARRRNIDPIPKVKLASPTYTDGTCSLIIAGSDGTFVDKIQNSGKPSLYGDNSATFGVELTPEGITFFEQAMKGQGPTFGVEYSLVTPAALPLVKVKASFHATEFYRFYQTIDVNKHWPAWKHDSYRETIRERAISSEAMRFWADWGMVTDEKVRGEIRDWAMRALEDGAERRMIEAIAPVPDDQRKKPKKIEHVTRDITSTKISSFTLTYKERQAIEWRVNPNGTLPGITTLKDADGNNYKWGDYFREIDLDDPFFRQLRVNVSANANFKELPIHSVEVKLKYNNRPMANMVPGEPEGEVVLRDPDKIGRLGAFVEADNWFYTHSIQINYTGHSRKYQSEDITTDEGNLIIGVDDIGILDIDISSGDLNWDDIDRALVSFSYEDRGVDRIEDQFQLSQANPTHKIQEVIFEPMRKNYKYHVKYFMKNGSEVQGDPQESRASNLFINDVFAATIDIGVRGVGDFAARIQNIFMDLRYDDDENDYHLTKSVALNAGNPFFEWSFPAISQTGGVVRYSASVAYKDGTSEDIPLTVAETNTILVPAPIEDFLEVMVITDLIDWASVRLARVSLHYQDPDNDVNERKSYVFSPTKPESQTWKIELKDKDLIEYSYSVQFFMTDQTTKTVGPETVSDQALILDPFQ